MSPTIQVRLYGSETTLPDTQLVIVGVANHIKSLSFAEFEARFNGLVSQTLFEQAVQRAAKAKTVPVYLNLCHVSFRKLDSLMAIFSNRNPRFVG